MSKPQVDVMLAKKPEAKRWRAIRDVGDLRTGEIMRLVFTWGKKTKRVTFGTDTELRAAIERAASVASRAAGKRVSMSEVVRRLTARGLS